MMRINLELNDVNLQAVVTSNRRASFHEANFHCNEQGALVSYRTVDLLWTLSFAVSHVNGEKRI